MGRRPIAETNAVQTATPSIRDSFKVRRRCQTATVEKVVSKNTVREEESATSEKETMAVVKKATRPIILQTATLKSTNQATALKSTNQATELKSTNQATALKSTNQAAPAAMQRSTYTKPTKPVPPPAAQQHGTYIKSPSRRRKATVERSPSHQSVPQITSTVSGGAVITAAAVVPAEDVPVSTRTRSKSTVVTNVDADAEDAGTTGRKKAGRSKVPPVGAVIGAAGATSKAPSNRRSHEDPSQSIQECVASSEKGGQAVRAYDPEMVQRYLEGKRRDVAQMKLLREDLIATQQELERKTRICKEQAKITDGILANHLEMWEASLGSPSALMQYRLQLVMTKQEEMKRLLNLVKAHIESMVIMLEGAHEPAAATTIKDALVTATPLKLDGGTHGLQALLEDAVSARSKKGASEEDAYVYVGRGKFPPELVYAMVSVGILRMHAQDPTRVCLNFQLGRI
ncbi:hypothetical protein BV898_11024 [Hypsibius exemplaris]|uniref:Uncharacterized protein n=1 Tax=Hypsibius exemplaris TaxID=2072580 RepID=A0A1W0WHS6_HYPEX|nr:hypothetical protein BV898_11024 [Hypsibius exemplaris]